MVVTLACADCHETIPAVNVVVAVARVDCRVGADACLVEVAVVDYVVAFAAAD